MGSLREVAPDRDLFANFERMRREMDELFGDVFDRGMAPLRRGGFSPAVDVYYTGDPPRAVVRADLAGVDPAGIALEIRGRELGVDLGQGFYFGQPTAKPMAVDPRLVRRRAELV